MIRVKGKNLIAAFLFLVSWQQYELTPQWSPENLLIVPYARSPDYYTVETVDHSIKLKTQSDVNSFIPHEGAGYQVPGFYPNMFNVQVKEIKDEVQK